MDKIGDENNCIIKEISNEILKLKINDMEKMLVDKLNAAEDICNDVRICSEQDLYRAMERLLYYINRVNAVNEKAIMQNDQLKNRIQQLLWQLSLPCSVEFFDMPINSSVYVIQLFYRKLHEKYSNEPIKYMILGLSRNTAGRRLNINFLDDPEKAMAQELDLFLNYIIIRNLFNELINVEKNIIYNYSLQDNET